MGVELSRKHVTALAKLNFSELSALSHMQRIDAFARVFGFENNAALMATLKSQEGASSGCEEVPEGPSCGFTAMSSMRIVSAESAKKVWSDHVICYIEGMEYNFQKHIGLVQLALGSQEDSHSVINLVEHVDPETRGFITGYRDEDGTRPNVIYWRGHGRSWRQRDAEAGESFVKALRFILIASPGTS